MITHAPADFQAMPAEVRHATVLEVLRAEVGAAVDVDPEFLEDDTTLPDLGLDSLALVTLAERLREWAGTEIPPAALPVTGTLDDVARAIAAALGAADPIAALQAAADDRIRAAIEADLYLTEGTGSAQDAVSAAEAAAPRAVLLTGATGFVGAHLLHALIEETDATIHCLVRAASTADGMDRLAGNLARFGLAAGALRDRVVVEPGDLAAPRLGLAPDRYVALARGLDLIYHNGAAVHLTQTYEEARAANVAGTRTILHLAGTERLKLVAVVSTVGLLDTPELDRPAAISEDDGPRDPMRLPNGYTRSKWVGERLVERARAAGVPAATLRVGHVIGHGVSTDLAGRLVQAAFAARAVPVLERPVDYVPPRYVARAIARLPREPGFGGTYHVVNPAPFDAADQAALMPMSPVPLALLPLRDWVARLRTDAARDPGHPLAPVADALIEEGGVSFVERVLRRPRVDCVRTVEALRGTGIVCPAARDVFAEVAAAMPELRDTFRTPAAQGV